MPRLIAREGVTRRGRKTKVRADILYREARLANHARCTSRRQDTDILLDEALSQVQQSCLVEDRNDGDLLLRHVVDIP